VYWLTGQEGETCATTCGGWCNENLLTGISSDQTMIDLATDAGNPCDTSKPMGYSEFPMIDDTDGSCNYPHSIPAEADDLCTFVPDPPVHLLCWCSTRYTVGNWHLSDLGQTCLEVCPTRSGECAEEPMVQVDSSDKVVDIMDSIGSPCDMSKVVFAHHTPYQTEDGQCAFVYMSGPTCSMVPEPNTRRFCPCLAEQEHTETDVDPFGNNGEEDPPPPPPEEEDSNGEVNAKGDPHLANLAGEKFDINREGESTFLVLPRSVVSKTEVQLRVDARITRPSTARKCSGGYITKMWITGTAFGEEIEVSAHGQRPDGADALLVRIGEERLRNEADFARATHKKGYDMKLRLDRKAIRMDHVNNRIRFADLTLSVGGTDLGFTWMTGRKRPNSLNFKAKGLGKLGKDWGGLLGRDDHYWVTQFGPECIRREAKYERMPQLLERNSSRPDAGEELASASLD